MKPPVSSTRKRFVAVQKRETSSLIASTAQEATLIAAQRLGRRVYAVEIEPKFCDLTIKRFEAETGLKARVLRNEKAL
jgi:hypothetical protein